MGIDFNSNAMLSAGFQNLVDVDLISWAALELPPDHVAENGRIGILDRLEDTLGLFLFGHFEAAVNAGDDKIKVAQNAVGVVRLGPGPLPKKMPDKFQPEHHGARFSS